MILISVIMPVYNVEKYLSISVDSILNQTFINFELILIDDGSTDNSGILCDEYAAQDSRIRVIHVQNGGVSNARNIGLKQARGKYVYFCDSDDYLDSQAFEIIIKTLERYHADLLIFGYYFKSDIKSSVNQQSIDSYPVSWNDSIFYPSKESIKESLVDLWNKSLMYNIWNKVYRLDIIKSNDIEFSIKLTMGEDLDFTNKYFIHCNSFYVLKDCFYYYIREREGSATTRYVKDWFEIRVEEHERLLDFFSKYKLINSESKEFLSRRFIERVIGCIENEFSIKNNSSRNAKLRQIKKIINNDYTREALYSAKLTSKKMKIMVIPLRIKSVLLVYCMGIMLSQIRTRLPRLFMKLKQSR